MIEKYSLTYEDYPKTNSSYEDGFAAYMQNVNSPEAMEFLREHEAFEQFNIELNREKNESQLESLSVGFKIFAVVNAIMFCFPLIYLIFGIWMLTLPTGGPIEGPERIIGVLFIVFSSVIMLMGWSLSICNWLAGKYFKEQVNYTFCFVISCINCVFSPLAAIAGIFGIVVLARDTVKGLFNKK